MQVAGSPSCLFVCYYFKDKFHLIRWEVPHCFGRAGLPPSICFSPVGTWRGKKEQVQGVVPLGIADEKREQIWNGQTLPRAHLLLDLLWLVRLILWMGRNPFSGRAQALIGILNSVRYPA